MPKISEKGRRMPESPIRKLVPYADIAKKAGRKVYHLNIGQPDIETPEVALNAIRNFSQKVVEKTGISAKICKDNIESMSFAGNSFDALLCFRMFHPEVRSKSASKCDGATCLCSTRLSGSRTHYISPCSKSPTWRARPGR